MYATSYHRASSVEDAVRLRTVGDDSTYLSGGMTLISTMKQRLAAPSDLVDLRHIPALLGISIEGRKVTIGAATPHADVAKSSELRMLCPALCHLAGHIGDPHVRNMGTIGGSIANNDPAADYPAAVLALGATVTTDRRSILADDFFIGLFETALQEGEMVTGVSFDAPETAGYAKFNNPASRFAMAGGGAGAVLDVAAGAKERGLQAGGTVHHVAFRAPDLGTMTVWQQELLGQGVAVTQILDRQYFKSIYFREPGGVLFEIATDAPGFAVDEPLLELGRHLKLPPWLEPDREQIAAALPPLRLDAA